MDHRVLNAPPTQRSLAWTRSGEAGPLILAGLAGAGWGLCFGKSTFLIAPWLALLPLVLMLGQKRPFLLGLVFGAASWMVAIPWIVPTLTVFGHIEGWLAGLLWVGLTAYLGLYVAAFAALAAPVWRRGSALPVLLGLPAIWVALEGLRAVLLTGFPWNLAAYAVVDVPGTLAMSAWGGAWSVSFLLVFVNVALAQAVRTRKWSLAVFAVLLPATILGLAVRFSFPVAPADGLTSLREVVGRPVRVVQPNVPNLPTWDPQAARTSYESVMALAREACDVRGALVVLPESATWPYALDEHVELRADLESLMAMGCPVLFNTPRFHDQATYYNSAYLLGDGGDPAAVSFADKRHLVPFGEYVPLARLFPFMQRLARAAGDFSPADEIRLLEWGRERWGAAICFEVIFPGETAALVGAGATALVTLTNDAWYGDTAAPWQHFRAARFRAAETRRPLVRAAITGISAVVEPDGAVESWLGPGERGILRAVVGGRNDLTPYVRAPWLFPGLCWLVAAAVILLRR